MARKKVLQVQYRERCNTLYTGQLQAALGTATEKIKSLVQPKPKPQAQAQAQSAPVVNNNGLVQQALTALGMMDPYWQVFLDNDIDDEAMLLLQHEDLPALFPKVGARVKFRRWLQQYRGDRLL